MVCPKCNSQSVIITNIQTSAKTKNSNMGCLWLIGRWFLILCTCGLWLFIGKRKNSGKIKFENEKQALCQSCGYSWKL